MKRFSTAIAVLVSVFGTVAFSTPQVGQEAPDFRLLDQNDHVQRLSAARGQKVVLVFYRGYW